MTQVIRHAIKVPRECSVAELIKLLQTVPPTSIVTSFAGWPRGWPHAHIVVKTP